MPGLTLNTNGALARPSSSSSTSQTPIPVPNLAANFPSAAQPPNHQPLPSQSQSQSQQTPPPRTSSPPRPTYSPITPPLNPVALPPRPAYTYASHQNAVAAAPPPPPEPLDFDANPDVLALKSAISILQLQRRRAEADMAALARAKAAAVAEPEEFVRDLTTGRVGVEGDRLFVGGVRTGGAGAGNGGNNDDEDSDSESSSDAEMEDAGQPVVNSEAPVKTEAGSDVQMAGVNGPGQPVTTNSRPPTTHPQKNGNGAKKEEQEPPTANIERPWAKLPKPQSVVRCPPINWSNYAVVGESLDKLHNEQLARPTQGTPAIVAPDGRYEFKGGDGKQEKLIGIAAPYMPGRDRLEKKPKGPKR